MGRPVGADRLSAEPFETSEPPETAPADAAASWSRYIEVLVALGVIVMGAVILVETRDIRVPRAFTAVGPRDFPRIIGAGLVILGIWYAIDVIRGGSTAPSSDSEDADASLPADWGTLGQLAVTLVLYALLMRPGGFIVASAVLFLGTAISFGSRRYLRDAAFGVVLAVATYLLFSEWLGIRLPAGILEGIL